VGARVTRPGPEQTRPRIAWSGDGVALRPRAETTGFRFDLADAQVGQGVTRRVAVLVVDSDLLSATAELIVRIHITPADADGDDFPPICKIKPWLPVSGADGAHRQVAAKRAGLTAGRRDRGATDAPNDEKRSAPPFEVCTPRSAGWRRE
jgi:hypothetical protein